MAHRQPVCIRHGHTYEFNRKNIEMSENGDMSETQYADGVQPAETVFHAVYIPQDNVDSSGDGKANDNVRVYQDKAEALKVIKENKTARLKTFTKRSDAEEFAKTGYQLLAKPSAIVAEEPYTNLKAPKPQELVAFRKLIESGDIEAVKSIIWENPMYLISCGSRPAILQEGCRYNALHIAVKAGKSDMCQLILNTVGNSDFIKILYGEEECRYVDPAQIMLDLYLNTPDKGLNETPLHFAVKFGLKDVVRVLVSHPQCITTLPNKYKQMPIDIICSRKCQDDEKLKKEIRMLLEDQYYVPVLRSEDDTLQPVIGDPFSPTKPLNIKNDPISPRVQVRAVAGPMPKSQAVEFRKKWKTPPRLRLKTVKEEIVNDTNNSGSPITSLALRLQDTEKGLERVGRDLAEEYQVAWREYWPFLDGFADFRCTPGLVKLEKYLEQKNNTTKRLFDSNMRIRQRATPRDRDVNANTKEKIENINDEINEICSKLQSCKLSPKAENAENGTTEYIATENHVVTKKNSLDELSDGDDSDFYTPPSSPLLARDSSDDEMFIAEEGAAIFINGDTATKIDYAVYNAVPSTIDRFTYPYIYRWRHEMQLAMKRNTFRNNSSLISRRIF